MKNCQACGHENPEEALFCMRCARDLSRAPGRAAAQEKKVATFTPAGEADRAGTASRRRALARDGEQLGLEEYKQAAFDSIPDEALELTAAVQEPAEMAPGDIDACRRSVTRRPLPPAAVPRGDEPEISHVGLRADFMETKRYCGRCGVGNHMEQKYCRHCGSSLDPEAEAEADLTYDYEAPRPIPLDPPQDTYPGSVPDMTTTAASDYYRGDTRTDLRKRRVDFSSGLQGWGFVEWLILTVLAIAVAAAVWLFAFGGYSSVFGSVSRNLRSAGAGMEHLPGLRYSVTASLEAADGAQCSAVGTVMHDAPASTYWEMDIRTPGAGRSVASVQVEDRLWVNGPSWQEGDRERSTADLARLWRDFSSTEDLGAQQLGAFECLHYRYRVAPAVIATALGADERGASDAVIEVWIEKGSRQIRKLTATVYNLLIEGRSTKASLAFDLVSAGQPSGIKPPR